MSRGKVGRFGQQGGYVQAERYMGSGRKVTGTGAKGGWERVRRKSLRIVAMHKLTGIYV